MSTGRNNLAKARRDAKKANKGKDTYVTYGMKTVRNAPKNPPYVDRPLRAINRMLHKDPDNKDLSPIAYIGQGPITTNLQYAYYSALGYATGALDEIRKGSYGAS